MDEPSAPEGDGKPRRNETQEQPAGSISRRIGDLKAGDEQAIQPLWDRYFTTLVERAREKLWRAPQLDRRQRRRGRGLERVPVAV